jgi:hypothetical protein
VLFRYTLITDGTSDRVLKPILNYICGKNYSGPVEGQWFDPRRFSLKSVSLTERILAGVEYFPCDILFIHRDAEAEDPKIRYDEIMQAVLSVGDQAKALPHICVVPVRMTEAWLLFDEKAIRWAAGNPNGTTDLQIPKLKEHENLSDPKSILFNAIKIASGRNRRRRKKLNLFQCRLRTVERISDFSPLRTLSAFRRLEDDTTAFFEGYRGL